MNFQLPYAAPCIEQLEKAIDDYLNSRDEILCFEYSTLDQRWTQSIILEKKQTGGVTIELLNGEISTQCLKIPSGELMPVRLKEITINNLIIIWENIKGANNVNPNQ